METFFFLFFVASETKRDKTRTAQFARSLRRLFSSPLFPSRSIEYSPHGGSRKSPSLSPPSLFPFSRRSRIYRWKPEAAINQDNRQELNPAVSERRDRARASFFLSLLTTTPPPWKRANGNRIKRESDRRMITRRGERADGRGERGGETGRGREQEVIEHQATRKLIDTINQGVRSRKLSIDRASSPLARSLARSIRAISRACVTLNETAV